MEHIDYRVLAPDSVAWFIQAALVADRTGNTHTRDLALAEARRIAEERRLVEQPAPGGSRVLVYDVAAHECNGVRLDATSCACCGRKTWLEPVTVCERCYEDRLQ